VSTARPRYCAPAQLRLSQGPRVSEATEQHTLIVVFRNTSGIGCDLRGYPEIQLRDRLGTRLAFTYQRRGDQMITDEPPVLVTLLPGGVAYAAANQNTCDSSPLAQWRQAASISVTPPGVDKPLNVELQAYPSLYYCGPGQADNHVDVTPVEPTLAAIYPDH
jgi:Protein of unknown function (DUF4232)